MNVTKTNNLPAHAVRAAIAETKRRQREALARCPEDIRGLAIIAAEGGWLYGFLHTVLTRRARGENVTPLQLHSMATDEIVAECLRNRAGKVQAPREGWRANE